MIGDTILALASPDSAAERAVLRISGPAARAVAALVFAPGLPAARGQCEGVVRVRSRDVETLALVMPGPGSFTGEDVVELHVPGSPLLCAVLREDLLARGAGLGLREALPGEFTARACTNGRLGPEQAEGILLLLHAADRRELAAGAEWLRGGLAQEVDALRRELQDVLALLESGLDFSEGETGTVDVDEIDRPLCAIEARAGALLATLPAAAPGGEVLLLGAANAGKSSLCNALAGARAVLVDGRPGTTRDLVRVTIGEGDAAVALWDAPGDLEEPAEWDRTALELRDRLAGRAAAGLAVVDATAPRWPRSAGEPRWLAVVVTKCDLCADPELPAVLPAELPAGLPVIRTSTADGRGLDELLALLRRAARAGTADAGGPLRRQLGAVAGAVARAREVLPAGAELAAVELQAALAALGDHSPEDLLDRIYGRFCLGK